uniref:Uncharacterized protein n=1 Tax=Spironucleus salmonicida TaxID=348837 RepID=V6LWK0_9EUKA|eukprot:EST49017.1 Hypothetical protein SS50377_10709 [Spironucleus salmonicida]
MKSRCWARATLGIKNASSTVSKPEAQRTLFTAWNMNPSKRLAQVTRIDRWFLEGTEGTLGQHTISSASKKQFFQLGKNAQFNVSGGDDPQQMLSGGSCFTSVNSIETYAVDGYLELTFSDLRLTSWIVPLVVLQHTLQWEDPQSAAALQIYFILKSGSQQYDNIIRQSIKLYQIKIQFQFMFYHSILLNTIKQ